MYNTREINIGNVTLPNRLFFAPMAGISNMALRKLMKSHGAGLVFTEMICAEGVVRNIPKTMRLMAVSPEERPSAIQLFGRNPDSLAKASQIASEQADIIDLNFGCPARTVVNNGSGSALMRQPELIREITNNVVELSHSPVTAKIRSGWDKNSINAVEIAKIIEDCGASAVIVHPRTKSQGFSGLSDWNIIKDVKNAVKIPVIGNGDIKSPQDVKAMFELTNCDAVMIGRGALGDPWIFSRSLTFLETGIIPPKPSDYERLTQLLDFARSLVDLQGEHRACKEIRKFIKWWTKGLPNITEIRQKAMHIQTFRELEDLMSPYIEFASKEQCNISEIDDDETLVEINEE
ncbi:TPA: tRNA dihydrouridine synthase DusB [Candidatus Poribacteria bacterium]|nr:tRNA dihydrouridine synthase DusB [Candidatus Poribacteria bacterium]